MHKQIIKNTIGTNILILCVKPLIELLSNWGLVDHFHCDFGSHDLLEWHCYTQCPEITINIAIQTQLVPSQMAKNKYFFGFFWKIWLTVLQTVVWWWLCWWLWCDFRFEDLQTVVWFPLQTNFGVWSWHFFGRPRWECWTAPLVLNW